MKSLHFGVGGPLDFELREPQIPYFADSERFRHELQAQSLGKRRGAGNDRAPSLLNPAGHALPQILAWLASENVARVERGEAPIKVIDYEYLLPSRPPVPPLLGGIGRALIDQVAPVEARRRMPALGDRLIWP